MLVYTYLNTAGRERQIKIKLLDTPFVSKWKDYLRKTSKDFPTVRWGNGLIGHGTYDKFKDPWPTIDTLFNSFKFLNRYTDFSLEHEDYMLLKECRTFDRYVNNIEQKHLNRWHRFFTTLAAKYRDGLLTMSDEVSKEEIYQNIHNINIYVHALEYMTYPNCERRKPFGDHQYHYRFSPISSEYNGYSPDTNDQMFATEHTVMMDEEFDFLTQGFEHTVWLNEDILGKDQFKAWLDHDDLSEDDITGNLFMTPSVILDPNRIIETVLKNPEFIEESKACGKKFNRYPVGDIVDINKIDWANDFIATPNFLTHAEGVQIKKIELDGEILWENKIVKYIKFFKSFEPATLLPRFYRWTVLYDVKFRIEQDDKILKIFFDKDEDYETFFLHWDFKRDTRCYVFCMEQIVD